MKRILAISGSPLKSGNTEVLLNAALDEYRASGFETEFHWIPLADVAKLEVYPTNTAELLGKLDGGVEHFVYREM